ncbi:hypothetical protein Poly51_53100 [Rubripirellula tenax]|uniref:Uncharacterized protein n=1 Tax=Rubripirellula tenax TaxID=2528015 RepID=A0A5C6EFY5_9BACT|nr:hypothetical protein [Rubripirellula tenax]TWU47510.1 hypothetical protein Poly51_53100 [Rubripirellula tenax]
MQTLVSSSPFFRLAPVRFAVGFAVRFNALCLVLAMGAGTANVHGSDWLTRASTYTHDPMTGARVAQYAQVASPAAPAVSNFRSSGYTHTRSSIAYGQSADNYHRVETWGDPVRPYGEWNFPNRPFSAPYQNWGPPYAGLNLGLGGVYPGYGQPVVGYGGNLGYQPGVHGQTGYPARGASPFNPYPTSPNSPFVVPPYYDGYHPVYRE